MGKQQQQQQGRNDQSRAGESGSGFGMMGGSDLRQGRDDTGTSDRASASGASTSGEAGRQSSTHVHLNPGSTGDTGGSLNPTTSDGSTGDQREGRRNEAFDRSGQRNARQEASTRVGALDRGEMGQDFNDSYDSPSSRGGWQEGQRSFGALPQPQGGRRRPWRRSPQCARDVMTRNPRTVRPTDTVQQVAQLMIDEDTGIIPVVDNGRLVGVVTDRDIVCRLVATGADLRSAKASEVMTTEVECVTEDESLQEVLEVMGQHQIRRVAVVASEDRLVGIISMADLAREADVDERLQEAFEEISAERSFWSKMR